MKKLIIIKLILLFLFIFVIGVLIHNMVSYQSFLKIHDAKTDEVLKNSNSYIKKIEAEIEAKKCTTCSSKN